MCNVCEHEDKQTILNLLLPCLQATDNLWDLVALTYIEEVECVRADFKNGGWKRVNVAADSGTAMIQDILKVIV